MTVFRSGESALPQIIVSPVFENEEGHVFYYQHRGSGVSCWYGHESERKAEVAHEKFIDSLKVAGITYAIEAGELADLASLRAAVAAATAETQQQSDDTTKGAVARPSAA